MPVTAQVAPPVSASAVPPTRYAAAQLDQMLAPIALYPDPVLAAVLMAASYPLEVVQADRWLQDGANAQLQGTQLAQAVQSQAWDASVKSLVAFPQILAMMDNALDWTQQLGDAFVAQQADVMDSVQRLRAMAQAARTLVPSPQQSVEGSPWAIDIEPAAPDSVSVPVYDPSVAYGPWPYADYPPDALYPPGYGYGSVIVFAIVAPLWGWNHWNWGGHGLLVGGGTSGHPGSLLPRSAAPRPWRFNPEHRRGVPFQDPVVRTAAGAPWGAGALRGDDRSSGTLRATMAGRYVAAPRAAPPAAAPPPLEPPRPLASPHLPTALAPPAHPEPEAVHEAREHRSRAG